MRITSTASASLLTRFDAEPGCLALSPQSLAQDVKSSRESRRSILHFLTISRCVYRMRPSFILFCPDQLSRNMTPPLPARRTNSSLGLHFSFMHLNNTSRHSLCLLSSTTAMTRLSWLVTDALSAGWEMHISLAHLLQSSAAKARAMSLNWPHIFCSSAGAAGSTMSSPSKLRKIQSAASRSDAKPPSTISANTSCLLLQYSLRCVRRGMYFSSCVS
mmetsp:Transcript_10041/g.24747  ORF Transcript_10041/g.24747 Transcript_10041/m.24747 type:complete len:217 (+) Transcript_10041:1161-1811(+)